MAETKRRDGVEFIAYLPDWYDNRGSLIVANGVIIITHPEHPPHVWNSGDNRWDEVKPS